MAGGEAVPGVPLAFTVTACNMLGRSDEGGVTELSPGSSVPSAAPPPVVMALNSTTIVVGVREPPAPGRLAGDNVRAALVDRAGDDRRAIELVGTPPSSTRCTTAASTSRMFQVREVGAGGKVGDVLLVQSGAVVLPNTPLDVDVVDGTIGARGFTFVADAHGQPPEGLIHTGCSTTGSISST